MSRWAVVLFAYAAVGLLGGGVASALWGSPWLFPEPWLPLPSLPRHALSVTVGAAFGVAVALLSTPLAQRFRWASVLAEELAPIARSIPRDLTLLVALLSAVGEEFLFRAAVMPGVGLVASALIFGFLHQMRGPARWPWALSATCMGLCLGALYGAFGSLIGPILAHAIINAMNLRMLRDREAPLVTRTPLGGVLGTSVPR
jgi:uncharacterized protein